MRIEKIEKTKSTLIEGKTTLEIVISFSSLTIFLPLNKINNYIVNSDKIRKTVKEINRSRITQRKDCDYEEGQ